MAKAIRSIPIAATRENIKLPLGYRIMHVGNLHAMLRLYVVADFENRMVMVAIRTTHNSEEIPEGFDYVGTIETSNGYDHVWSRDD